MRCRCALKVHTEQLYVVSQRWMARYGGRSCLDFELHQAMRELATKTVKADIHQISIPTRLYITNLASDGGLKTEDNETSAHK